MKLQVGDRVKGFEFERIPGLCFNPEMIQYLNIVGVVEDIYPSGVFGLRFPDDEYWYYPLNHKLAKPI